MAKKQSEGVGRPFLYERDLSGIDREKFKAELQTEAENRAVAFPETIEAVREVFRTYAPDHVLSVTSGYALQTTATDTAVFEKLVGGPNLGQHHIELL